MCVLKNGVGHITIVIPGKSQGREAFKEHIVHLDDSSYIYILFFKHNFPRLVLVKKHFCMEVRRLVFLLKGLGSFVSSLGLSISHLKVC